MSLENYKKQKGEGVCSFRYEIEIVDGLRDARRVFLTQRELVPLPLFFQWTPALDPGLLLLEFHTLAFELLFHFAMASI
jgi:hypothetical protein